MDKELQIYLIPDLANIVAEYANPWVNAFDWCVRELNIKIWNGNLDWERFDPNVSR